MTTARAGAAVAAAAVAALISAAGPGLASAQSETPAQPQDAIEAPADDGAGAESFLDRAARALERLESEGAFGDEAEIRSEPGIRVTLRGLDKMTGLVETIEADVGSEARFERLVIDVKACFLRIGDRSPESSAFLQIFDDQRGWGRTAPAVDPSVVLDQAATADLATADLGTADLATDTAASPVAGPSADAAAASGAPAGADPASGAPAFSGWMFASSPALSAMDHPRYDLWLLRCSTS